MPGEFDFIQWVRTQQKPGGAVILTASDDLAILQLNDLIVIGIDQILDGVHFDSTVHAPEAIGRKAMNRNLSDCAAMACLPVAAVVSVALHRGTSMDFAKSLYSGMKEAGDAFGCAIVGGDTGSWDQKLAISIAILGRADGITPIRRSGAKEGDAIYVTGALGGSILGRHLTFTPRVHEARDLAGRYRVSAMIDLSDGLSRDLAHICRESSVGAVINAGAIPIHPDVRQLPGEPLDHALHDGEDYELCFTGDPGIEGVTRIGTIVSEPGVWIEREGSREPLQAKAFEHRL